MIHSHETSTHAPPPLDTSRFDAACREPDCSGFASDRDIHPNRLIAWAMWAIGAAIIIALAVGALTP